MTDQLSIMDILADDDREKITPKTSNEWRWTFLDYPKEKNGLKVFSCFACGGGSTMGYKLAGCDVLGDCEIDPQMNDIYLKNHNPKYNYRMDIRDFKKLDNLPDELYNLDILDGSPPCTTFSMAGLREENWGKSKKFKEGQAEQILDELSFVFIETAAKLKPKIVIMENVEGLLIGEAYSYVKQIYKQFNDIGYKLHHWLLYGEWMGVPQTRHRVFFVAIRKDLNIDPANLNMTFNFAPITYGEIKEGVGRPLNPKTQTYKMLCQAIPDDLRIGDIFKRLGQKERCFNSKIAWDDKVLQTITANLDYNRAKEKTRISIEDIIHAQTFPENYDFGSREFANVSYICGMSVPPLMIKRIVTRLIEQGVFDYKKGTN